MADLELSRRGLLGMSAGAALMLSAGCGGGDSPSGALKKLTMATSLEPNFALVMGHAGGNDTWQMQVFNYLAKLSPSGNPQAELATDWSISPDQRTVKLSLRKDVKYHSGRPFTAADVIYTLKQAANPANGQLASVAALIEDMSADDDHSVTLRLSKPTSQLFVLFHVVPMVDSETFANIGKGTVVGTGPFEWDKWRPGASISLKRNPDYWGPQPTLEQVEILIIAQSQALIAAARGHRSQLTYWLSALDAETLRGAADVAIDYDGAGLCYALGFNTTVEPFNNADVRRAIAKAIDRDRIADQVFKGHAEATNLWSPSTTPGWDESLNSTYSYDPDAARQELQQLGLSGLSTKISSQAGNLPAGRTAEIIRFNLEEAGLGCTVESLETTDFVDRLVNGKFPNPFINPTGFGYLSNVANASFSLVIKPGGATQFESPEYSKLIESAATASPADEADANSALNQYMVEQAFSLPLVIGRLPIVRESDIEGVQVFAAGGYTVLDKVSSR